MRFKQRKHKPSRLGTTYPVAETDALWALRVDAGLIPEIMGSDLADVYKFTSLENGRLLGRRRGGWIEILASFLTAPERGRARENWRKDVAQQKEEGALFIEELDAEPDREGWSPTGYVLPRVALATMEEEAVKDPDLAEHRLLSIADRMDREGPGDYVIPDLTPLEYEIAQEIRRSRKPQ